MAQFRFVVDDPAAGPCAIDKARLSFAPPKAGMLVLSQEDLASVARLVSEKRAEAHALRRALRVLKRRATVPKLCECRQ